MTDALVQASVMAYLDAFSHADLEKLAGLLAPDLKFAGPDLVCNSAEVYLQALIKDPPEPAALNIQAIVCERNKVAVLYDYPKKAGVMRIAQFFTMQQGLIKKSGLVYSKHGGDVHGF